MLYNLLNELLLIYKRIMQDNKKSKGRQYGDEKLFAYDNVS